jgi:hypothetical protein
MKRSRGRGQGGQNNGGMGGGSHGGPRNQGGGNRPGNITRQTYDSNGPDVRVRGNAYQVYEKYLTLARDSSASGDRIQAENYYQHAEHYYRLISAAHEAQGMGPYLPNQQQGRDFFEESENPAPRSEDGAEGEGVADIGAEQPDLDGQPYGDEAPMENRRPRREDREPREAREPRESREPREPREPRGDYRQAQDRQFQDGDAREQRDNRRDRQDFGDRRPRRFEPRGDRPDYAERRPRGLEPRGLEPRGLEPRAFEPRSVETAASPEADDLPRRRIPIVEADAPQPVLTAPAPVVQEVSQPVRAEAVRIEPVAPPPVVSDEPVAVQSALPLPEEAADVPVKRPRGRPRKVRPAEAE